MFKQIFEKYLEFRNYLLRCHILLYSTVLCFIKPWNAEGGGILSVPPPRKGGPIDELFFNNSL